jgi:hypothetical protein
MTQIPLFLNKRQRICFRCLFRGLAPKDLRLHLTSNLNPRDRMTQSDNLLCDHVVTRLMIVPQISPKKLHRLPERLLRFVEGEAFY